MILSRSLPRREALILCAAAALAVGANAQALIPDSFGLEQRNQFGNPLSTTPNTISLDTPTASLANNNNFIVQVANSQILIRQSAPNNFVGRNHLSGNRFAASVPTFFGGALNGNRIVDNKILVDHNTDRFCITGMQQDSTAVGPAPNGQGLFVAFSQSTFPQANPDAPGSGGWKRWRTSVPTVPEPGAYQPDFNGMGQTDTHFVYSGVLQPVTFPNGRPFSFVRCIPKSALINSVGNLDSVVVDFIPDNPTFATSEFLHAADNFDANSPIYLAAVLIGSQQLRLVHANLASGNEDEVLLNVAPFVPATGAAPQPGGFLDTIDGRMASVVVRDGLMYCCHTVAVGPVTGPLRNVVRWYQIALNGWVGPGSAGTPQIMQTGTIDPGGTLHAFMPSVAVNGQGTMAITYTISSAAQNPIVAWAGRFATDPINTTPQGANLFTSASPFTTSGQTALGADRWGDWTCIVPRNLTNSEDFVVSSPIGLFGPPQQWPSSSFPQPANHWGTRIASFRIPSPPWRTFYPDPAGLGGTPGTTQIPTINAFPRARIGQTSTITVTNSGTASTVGVVALSLAAGTGAPSPFGPAWVDPQQMVTFSITINGASGSTPLAIPTDPAFIGNDLFLQGVVYDTASSTSWAVTGGMQLNVGS